MQVSPHLHKLSAITQDINEHGVSTPQPIFTRIEAWRLKRALADLPTRGHWVKSMAAHSAAYRTVAQHPKLMEVVKARLGNNVLLWGSAIVSAKPGHLHPWHSDVETAYHKQSISAWIGLQNMAPYTMSFVKGSHRFGQSVQAHQLFDNHSRSRLNDAIVSDWAQQHQNQAPAIYTPTASIGEAIFFDGRIWHSSINPLRFRTRHALLLQYADADVPIRVCENLQNPRSNITTRPPCLAIDSQTSSSANQILQQTD